MRLSEESWERGSGYVLTPDFVVITADRHSARPGFDKRTPRVLDAIAAVPELIALAESVRDSFFPSEERNNRKAKLNVSTLRKSAVKALKKAGCERAKR